MSDKTKNPDQEPEYDPHEDLQGLSADINSSLNGEDCKPEDMKVGYVMLVFPILDPAHANLLTNMPPELAAHIMMCHGQNAAPAPEPNALLVPDKRIVT